METPSTTSKANPSGFTQRERDNDNNRKGSWTSDFAEHAEDHGAQSKGMKKNIKSSG